MELEILPEGSTDAAISAGAVKFHISLNVRDLGKSIHFYQALFDREPAKQYGDYAKFELENPPLVLSLEPQPHAPGGALNHLGFRVTSAESLVAMQHRLESAGLPTTREDGVACCYAKQTKFWIADPDGNNWEIYILEEDVEHRGKAQSPQHAAAPSCEKAPTVWEHQLGTPFPDAIPLATNAADEVLLRGTFNEPLAASEVSRILSEVRRVMRVGGKLTVHGLVSNVRITGAVPHLPGPASAVRFMPAESWPIEALEAAGFAAIHIRKLSEEPVFRANGVLFRELLVEATKTESSPFAIRQTVIYRGPARELRDDLGNVYLRGRRTIVTSQAAEVLRSGPNADSFVFIPPGELEG